jgi:hypothetical protein
MGSHWKMPLMRRSRRVLEQEVRFQDSISVDVVGAIVLGVWDCLDFNDSDTFVVGRRLGGRAWRKQRVSGGH